MEDEDKDKGRRTLEKGILIRMKLDSGTFELIRKEPKSNGYVDLIFDPLAPNEDTITLSFRRGDEALKVLNEGETIYVKRGLHD